MKKPNGIEYGILMLIAIIGLLVIAFLILSLIKLLLKTGWVFAL